MNTSRTPEELVNLTNETIKKFKGDIPELESAIGMLFAGRQYGWKVMYLVHSKATIRKYEKILGVKIREVCPELGPLADRSVGWKIAKKVSNFWKEVTSNIHGARNAKVL